MPAIGVRDGRRLRLAQTRALSLAGPPSYRLSARPRDHGAFWPAVCCRCLQELPAELGWAALLLQAEPEPLLCGQQQAKALFRRLDSLPTTIQVSVCCERRREGPESRAAREAA